MPVTANSVIKIAIADDHKIFRDGIKMALSGKENLKMLLEKQLKLKKLMVVQRIQQTTNGT